MQKLFSNYSFHFFQYFSKSIMHVFTDWSIFFLSWPVKKCLPMNKFKKYEQMMSCEHYIISANLYLSCLTYKLFGTACPTKTHKIWTMFTHKPLLLHFSLLWHFFELLLITHSFIMQDMSIKALRQNIHLPRRLSVIRGWRNLQIPLSLHCCSWWLEE